MFDKAALLIFFQTEISLLYGLGNKENVAARTDREEKMLRSRIGYGRFEGRDLSGYPAEIS
jgi:hypothetical protein